MTFVNNILTFFGKFSYIRPNRQYFNNIIV